MPKDYPCPGKSFVDNAGDLHDTEWHSKGKCQFCKGGGSQRDVGGMPEIDRQGNPVIDFCCHQCKTNFKDRRSKVNTGIRTSIT